MKDFGSNSCFNYFLAEADITVVAIDDQFDFGVIDPVLVHVGEGALCGLEGGKFIGGDKENVVGVLENTEIPRAIRAGQIDDGDLVIAAGVVNDGGGIQEIVNALDSAFGAEQDIDALSRGNDIAPEISVEVLIEGDDIHEAVLASELEQEANSAGEGVKVDKKNFGGLFRPAKGEATGDSGGATGSLGRDDSKHAAGLVVGFSGRIFCDEAAENILDLGGGKRVIKKFRGAGAEALQDEVGLIWGEDSNDRQFGLHGGELFEEFEAVFTVTDDIGDSDVGVLNGKDL